MTGDRRTALAAAAARLAAAGVDGAAREARLLLRAVTGLSGTALAGDLSAPLSAPERARLAAAVAARAGRRPMAQILGRRAFWGRDFTVTADTLDPRPETETLVEAALAGPVTRVLDLGTGTGCLLLTLLAERPRALGLGTDRSGPALAVAARNSRRLGLAGRAAFARADWLDGLWGRYDLVISNPPYIAAAEMAGLAPEVARHEPRAALTPGADALTAYHRIAAGMARVLAPGGRTVLEIGRGQAAEVSEILEAAGLHLVEIRPDLGGTPRAIVAAMR